MPAEQDDTAETARMHNTSALLTRQQTTMTREARLRLFMYCHGRAACPEDMERSEIRLIRRKLVAARRSAATSRSTTGAENFQ